MFAICSFYERHPFPPPLPLHQAITTLIGSARNLLSRLIAPRPVNQRLARTVEWVVALGRTLAGDRFFLVPIAYPRFPGRYPSLTAAVRQSAGLPPIPKPTPERLAARRAASRLHYMRKIFATQSTSRIAARLARRLGLTPTDAAWPTDLLAIPTPPAAWATRPAKPVAPACPPPTSRPWFPAGIPAATYFAALRLADAPSPHPRE